MIYTLHFIFRLKKNIFNTQLANFVKSIFNNYLNRICHNTESISFLLTYLRYFERFIESKLYNSI